jgi:formylglycine-generating enzyme required for sulfatase activity
MPKNQKIMILEPKPVMPIKIQNLLFQSANLRTLFIGLALLAGVHQAAAQNVRFFRISGPTATKIIAFRPDGTLVWTNARPGTNYNVQTMAALPGKTNWVDYAQLPATNGVNTNQIIAFNLPSGMAFIPAGVFTMGNSSGDPEINDADAVLVNVSAFYMDTNLVSYARWQSVYSWAANHGYGFANAGAGKAANNPVQIVDWFDCLKWCNARSQQEGLQPVYYTDAGLTQVYTNSQDYTPYVNWAANGYRLPTEAEWEKAARGGLSGQRFPWGNTISESQANYYGCIGCAVSDSTQPYDLGPNGNNDLFDTGAYPYTSPVGYFAANGYGLYDMAGNVSEWCWDWYALPPYPTGSPYLGGSDPRGPTSVPSDLFGAVRVMRGGWWSSDAYYARCAYRANDGPTTEFRDYGFRCVRGL